jgi:hypothetical protein
MQQRFLESQVDFVIILEVDTGRNRLPLKATAITTNIVTTIFSTMSKWSMKRKKIKRLTFPSLSLVVKIARNCGNHKVSWPNFIIVTGLDYAGVELLAVLLLANDEDAVGC